MHKLTTHFEQLLTNIQPPQHRLDAARDLPRKVRDYLHQHEEFPTVEPHSRLAGSYAQHTCVGDVKDVDFLVVVNGDPENNEPEAKSVVQDLKKALDDLPQALGYEEGNTVVERGRRSVHVYFRDEDFHVDAVPCIAPNGIKDVIYVPDRYWNKWVASHPIGYIDLITTLNDAHNYKVRPLIKLLKHFRNQQMIYCRPKSYWLGSLVIYHVRREGGLDTKKSLGELFHDLINAICAQYDHLIWTSDTATPNLEDPLLGHNISWNWSRQAFERFMRRLHEACDYSDKALAVEDRGEAIAYWRLIFGDAFPTEIEDAAQNMARTIWPGTSKVASTGLVGPTTMPLSRLTEVKPTKFHGDT